MYDSEAHVGGGGGSQSHVGDNLKKVEEKKKENVTEKGRKRKYEKEMECKMIKFIQIGNKVQK
jgi:hypothetical protein